MRAAVVMAVMGSVLLGAPDTVRAQQDFGSTSRGLSIGGDLIATVMRTRPVGRTKETPTGVGLRAVVSYGLDARWSVFGAIQTVSIRTGSAEALKHVEVGSRFTFLDDNSPYRPYLEGAIAGRTIRTRLGGNEDADVTSSGGAVLVAGGVQLFAIPRLPIDVALAISSGSFRDAEIAGQRVRVLDGSVPSTTLRIGAKYFLGGRRGID